MKEQVTLFSKKPILLSLFKSNSTVLVFAGTVIAYVIAILYETAYLHAFGLSPDLIEISPVIMFYSALLVVATYAVLELFSQFEHYFTFKEQEAKKNKNIYARYMYLVLNGMAILLYSVLILSVIFMLIIQGQLTITNIWNAAIVFVIFMVITALVPIMSQIGEIVSKRSVKAGIKKYFEKIDAKNSKKQFTSFLGGNVSLYFFFLIIAICIPIGYGSSSARAEKSYFVYAKTDDSVSVAIRHYGRNTIIKTYDLNTKKFVDGFTVASSDQTRTYSETYVIKRGK